MHYAPPTHKINVIKKSKDRKCSQFEKETNKTKQTLRHANGTFGFRAENAYRERKKCIEKISKCFILQKNYKVCRTDDFCIWRKENKTAHHGVVSGGENEADGQT